MNVSEVLDIKSNSNNSQPLHVGDKIVVKSFDVHFVESVGAEVAEIETTEGVKHSFAKAIVGQAKSKYWVDVVKMCIEKDASDGLNCWVVERPAKDSNRMLMALSMYEPSVLKVAS